MKKLLSLILTIAMISTILVSTTLTVGAASQKVLDYGFTGSKPSKITSYAVSMVSDSIGGNSTGVGFYDGDAETVTSSNPARMDIKDLSVDGSNSGLWIFETDMYIPKGGIPSGSKIQILSGPETGSAWSQHCVLNITPDKSENSGKNIYLNSYPEEEWFKLRYTFNYLPEGTADDVVTISIVYDNGVTDDIGSYAVNGTEWVTRGLYKTRISYGSSSEGYLDNVKYYQRSNLYMEDTLHYLEDFSKNSYDMSATSQKAADAEASATATKTVSDGELKLTHNTKSVDAGSTGIAKTVLDPTVSDKTVLKIESLDSLGERNRVSQVGSFKSYTSGVQVVDMDFYLFSDQIDTVSDGYIFIALAANSTWSGLQTYLRGSQNTPTGSDPYSNKFPRDEWFTLRFVMNFNNGIANILIEDKDGNIEIVKDSIALSNNMKTYGLSQIWIDGASAKQYFYVGEMRYYEQGCEAVHENYPVENYNSSNNMHISYKVSMSATNIRFNKGSSQEHGNDVVGTNVRWFRPVESATAAAVANPSSLIVSTKDVRKRGGITIASLDMKFTGARTSDEVIQVYLEKFNEATAVKEQYGGAIRICDGKIWYGEETIPSSAISHPLKAWFTLRAMYNHHSHYYRYEMIKNDGTVVLLGNGVSNLDQINDLGEFGVCGMTMRYDRPANGKSNTYDIYFDDIKLENIVLDKVSFDDSLYTATISYEANADTAISSKLVLAQYNTTGELISIQTATPVYTESATEATATFTKADGATKTKLMFLDDLNTVIPFATSIEK